jgi:tetratricopeptide (TPR) repeat protein
MNSFHKQGVVAFILSILSALPEYVNAHDRQHPPVAFAPNNDERFMQATILFFDGRFDESINLFRIAEAEYRAANNIHQVIACYLGIATCYSFKQDFKKSLAYNKKALRLHNKNIKNDQDGLSVIRSNCFKQRSFEYGSSSPLVCI